jgi:hypothetical protein
MPRYDLHSHSTYSDGLLAPAAVVQRAAARGVDFYALTDHDDTGGLAEAAAAARETSMTFVPGAELSVSWESQTIHIIALQIDPSNRTLDDGLAAIRSGRDARAHRIGRALAEAGIPGAYDGARRFVTSERLISRSHFARFLVEAGYAKRNQGRVQEVPGPGQTGLRRACVGNAARRRQLDSRGRRPGRGRPSGPLPGDGDRHATAARRIPRRRRRRHRSAVAVAHACAIHRVRNVCAHVRVSGLDGLRLSRTWRGWLDLGDLPPCPRA